MLHAIASVTGGAAVRRLLPRRPRATGRCQGSMPGPGTTNASQSTVLRQMRSSARTSDRRISSDSAAGLAAAPLCLRSGTSSVDHVRGERGGESLRGLPESLRGLSEPGAVSANGWGTCMGCARCTGCTGCMGCMGSGAGKAGARFAGARRRAGRLGDAAGEARVLLISRCCTGDSEGLAPVSGQSQASPRGSAGGASLATPRTGTSGGGRATASS